MTSVLCNDPKPTAYSFYWGCRIITIHAHTPGEDLSFYEALKEPWGSLWLHMPLDSNERIVDIWKRHRKFTQEATLIVSCLPAFGSESKTVVISPEQTEAAFA